MTSIARRHDIIRKVEADIGRPIAILADLQGPKLRCGVFAARGGDAGGGRRPSASTSTSRATPRRVQPAAPGDLRGARDGRRPAGERRQDPAAGRSMLGPDIADCEVEVGGTISNRKGVNVPDVVLPLAALTEKDRERPGVRLRARRRLAGAELRAARRRRRRGAPPGQRPRRGAVEDREARGGEGVRRDPRGLRRHHGRARRSRRRTAGAERAADPEAAGARLPGRRPSR